MPGIEDFLSAPAVPLLPGDSELDAGSKGEPLGSVEADGMGLPSAPPTTDWVLPVQHLSSTSLNMLAICPRQFQQRYILGFKQPPGQAQVVGSSFHKTMEYNFSQKIESHEDLNIIELEDYLLDEAFPTSVDQAQEDTGFEVRWDDQDDAKLSAVKMTTGYMRDAAPGVQPERVEWKFSKGVDGVPVPLVGTIDVVDDSFVIDLKSSKRKISKIKPAWRVQGRIYQLAHPQPTVFHIVTTKGEVMPKVMIPYSLHQHIETEAWVHRLAWTANDYYRRFGEDEWPATGVVHDWRCDWCGYKADCPAWKGA